MAPAESNGAGPEWFARAASEGLPASHWIEQAEWAKAHALQRPVGDVRGWVEDMNDRAAFLRLAAIASLSLGES